MKMMFISSRRDENDVCDVDVDDVNKRKKRLWSCSCCPPTHNKRSKYEKDRSPGLRFNSTPLLDFIRLKIILQIN